ncbi:neutral cholesterol ester hydrolase 1-like [Dunckerocampus dactyliophorus]|uniref:neutral cholesterol ester hydrolase 1-like n=1 Tax=Dunckerocampus dactyliophorus TaxID=161453 RepID=UPI002404DD48|nr:neutral cholesterol ester hydrolase 1-like [Dunckerocampus dactyliophorus]XP_054652405.1 neutral cholesterol ester hydrolase 1-like [Dunckerocampus dactyliophorus]XP_054652406.1 neutral cholesterol ester hydrolase 1-like [Dunckerocampus dactyliophorus]
MWLLVVLSVAVACYYLYTPLPAGIRQPWKLMLLDAVCRVVFHLALLMERLGLDHHVTLIRQISKGFEDTMKDSIKQGSGVLRVSDVTFDGIPVRVYEPGACDGEGRSRRGLLYFHGGGWAFGSAKVGSYDENSRLMSNELHMVLVSVEYRLYPEAHFPTQYLDCLAAAKHFLSPEVLAKYGVDPCRVGVSGDSAGGNLAAAVAQEVAMDDSMRVKFSVQALIYPVVQALDFNTPSYLQNQAMPILRRPLMVDFWLQYLGADPSLKSHFLSNGHQSTMPQDLMAHVDWTALLAPKYKDGYKPVSVHGEGSHAAAREEVRGLRDVRAAPLLARTEVLARCPRSYVMTCEYDVLRDDGLMYARRLQDAGVAVTSDHYKDGFHGCLSLTLRPFQFDVGVRALRRYIHWLNDNL